MILGIDASRIGHDQVTGVELYSQQIISRLCHLIGEKKETPQTEVRLYVRTPLTGTQRNMLQYQSVHERVIRTPRLWTLYGLSRELFSRPVDRLFVPSHVLPPVHPRFSVMTVHDVAFRHFREAYSFSQYQYLDFSTRVAVKRAEHLIVPSEATREDLMEFYSCPAKKIHVIPHGFSSSLRDVSFEHAPAEEDVLRSFSVVDQPYILFVGRLELKKNVHRLLEAFAIFSHDHPEWKLLLIGKRGHQFDMILRTAQRLDIWEKILMPGYIDEHEKHVLLKHCQIFAFPSLYEGFGFPILEAFSYEKPVLTSKSSSMPEVGGSAAYYVDPLSVESIAGGLAELADNNVLVADFVEKMPAQLARFDWEICAEKTAKVLFD